MDENVLREYGRFCGQRALNHPRQSWYESIEANMRSCEAASGDDLFVTALTLEGNAAEEAWSAGYDSIKSQIKEHCRSAAKSAKAQERDVLCSWLQAHGIACLLNDLPERAEIVKRWIWE
jgi:hypothetical protein